MFVCIKPSHLDYHPHSCSSSVPVSIDVVLQFAGVAQLAAGAVVVVKSVLFLLQVFWLEVSWEIVVVQSVVGFVVAAG